ncbi:diguanylate cyclase [Natranaerobius thermophilus]
MDWFQHWCSTFFMASLYIEGGRIFIKKGDFHCQVVGGLSILTGISGVINPIAVGQWWYDPWVFLITFVLNLALALGILWLYMRRLNQDLLELNTRMQKHIDKLEHLSLHDQLTGIYNRAYFEEELERLDNSQEYPVTVISFDVDGLKLINDTIGHEQGDELIKTAAKIIDKSLRSSDIFARVGGDEFAILLPNTNNSNGGKVVNRILNNIQKYNQKNGKLPVQISVGKATASYPEESLKGALTEADKNMYQNKMRIELRDNSPLVNLFIKRPLERDYSTTDHANRIGELGKELGRRLQLSQDSLMKIDLLAKIHDIGKGGIPDGILFKPGPLDKREWEIMKQHSERGYKIALSCPDLIDVADLVLKHHESWDGTGYPLGLKEDEIPIECRIHSIVEAYDAMTRDRPYRKALSQEQALEELKRCKSGQFDPKIVEEFQAILYLKRSC